MVDEETKAAKRSAAHSAGRVSIKEAKRFGEWLLYSEATKIQSVFRGQARVRVFPVKSSVGCFKIGLHLAVSFAVALSPRSEAARKEKES